MRPLLVCLLVVLTALLLGQDTARATSFSPNGSLCLTETVPSGILQAACDSSDAPGANDSMRARFGIGLGPNGVPGGGDDVPDSRADGIVTFIPPEWGVAAGSDIPDGALVAQLNSIVTLGLIGNPCNLFLSVSFNLLDASTNYADTIAVLAPGQPDRLSPLADDLNGNGILDGAEQWPAYLNDVFDDAVTAGVPDPLPNIRTRMFGVNTSAAPGLTIVLNILIFEPGTQLSDQFGVDPRLGYPSLTVLNDPTAPTSGSDPVNDFCSPFLSVTNTFGLTRDNPMSVAAEGGYAYRTNPADGAYSFVTYTTSLPDADDDGIENQLDPCPYTQDPDWDPRSLTSGPVPGDVDGDGLPDSCDPYPNVPSPLSGSIRDEDADGWMNRADNCPTVSNPDNVDSDGDGIGDACDQNIGGGPGTVDGHVHSRCLVTVIDIGGGGTPSIDPHTMQPCDQNAPSPVFDFDGDGDGVVDVIDNCPDTQNPGQENADGDAWGDACDNCPVVATAWFVPAGDDDCDGFTTDRENHVGTNPTLACGTNAWPPDIDESGTVSAGDVFTVFDFWLTSVPRYDLDASGTVSAGDVFLIFDWWLRSCTWPQGACKPTTIVRAAISSAPILEIGAPAVARNHNKRSQLDGCYSGHLMGPPHIGWATGGMMRYLRYALLGLLAAVLTAGSGAHARNAGGTLRLKVLGYRYHG